MRVSPEFGLPGYGYQASRADRGSRTIVASVAYQKLRRLEQPGAQSNKRVGRFQRQLPPAAS